MTEARTVPDFADLVRQLADRAGAVATAKAETRALEQRKDPTRWRRAELLWPLFAKD